MANEKKYLKRYCKTLNLQNDPGLIIDYKKTHEAGAVWPEITQGMKDVGIIDMEIYIYGNMLFMIMDTIADFNHDKSMAELGNKPRQAEWEAYVSKFQETSPDSSAKEKWPLLERIYEMDQTKEFAPEDGQVKLRIANFKRYCKTLMLEQDGELIQEYKKVHGIGKAWTEITLGMKEVGIVDMEIYIHRNRLFMIMDTVMGFDHDLAMAKLAGKPRQAEWEAYVSKFQKASSTASADDKWQLMERIYKLDK